MLRIRFLGALAFAVIGLDGVLAVAAGPTASALEEDAQREFEQAGAALHARLEREAAGDAVGAQIAAREAETHRYRYLDLRRELDRRRDPRAFPVAAARDPFAPDTSSAASARVSPLRPTPPEERDRPWDMYRTHRDVDAVIERPQTPGRGEGVDPRPTDLDPADAQTRAPGGESAADDGMSDAPSRPVRVYRLATGDPAEHAYLTPVGPPSLKSH
jgi:hypothetical protein